MKNVIFSASLLAVSSSVSAADDVNKLIEFDHRKADLVAGQEDMIRDLSSVASAQEIRVHYNPIDSRSSLIKQDVREEFNVANDVRDDILKKDVRPAFDSDTDFSL
jgi:hypothetical protein